MYTVYNVCTKCAIYIQKIQYFAKFTHLPARALTWEATHQQLVIRHLFRGNQANVALQVGLGPVLQIDGPRRGVQLRGEDTFLGHRGLPMGGCWVCWNVASISWHMGSMEFPLTDT